MNQHGEYQASCDGAIITGKLIGSFNETGITAYTEAMTALVKAFDGKPFAMLVDLSEVEGGTPDAYAALERYNQWLTGQTLVAKAMLYQSFVQAEILFTRSPTLKKQNTELFIDKAKALVWLEQQVKTIDNT